MNRKPLVAVLSAFLLLLMGVYLWGVPTYGEPAPGVLHGTTLDARGLAVPQVQVTIHSIDENADQVVVSDGQGSFVVGNLKPGHYQLVAAKQGGASSQVTYLAVAAGDDLRFDMRLSETAPAAGGSPSSAPPAPAAASRSALSTREGTGRDEGPHCGTGSGAQACRGSGSCLTSRSSTGSGVANGVLFFLILLHRHVGTRTSPGDGCEPVRNACPGGCCPAGFPDANPNEVGSLCVR